LGHAFRVVGDVLEPAEALKAARLCGGIGVGASIRKLRILIVDDRLECARTLGRVATMLGHDVRTASDGPEAVEAAAEFRPDAVLMDVGLPGLDGYEAARHLRDQPWGNAITLVALTAFGQGIDERRFREAGFDHHLAKPVDVDALATLFGRALPPPG
jgi:CheY-like chemotaxis protein